MDSAGEADVTASLGVIAETSDQAEEEAVDAMRRIRANAASLQRLRSSSGISRPGGASPRPRTLSREAMDLFGQGRHDLAVVRL